ncbi:MAG: hypothetical protein AB7G93_21240 [Bdellovibrionales bacterium]
MNSMKRILFAVLVLGGGTSYSVAAAPAAPTASETAEFAMVTGFMLCPHATKPPPLEEAFICSGVQDYIDRVEVPLTPQPVSKPGWKLYSGRHTGTIDFNDFHVTYELLVSLASGDGEKYGFIDGRMIDNVNRRSTYFRIAVNAGFEEMNYVTSYGAPVTYSESGKKSDFIPQIVIAKSGAWGSSRRAVQHPSPTTSQTLLRSSAIAVERSASF